jgi:hypothetical protein
VQFFYIGGYLLDWITMPNSASEQPDRQGEVMARCNNAINCRRVVTAVGASDSYEQAPRVFGYEHVQRKRRGINVIQLGPARD